MFRHQGKTRTLRLVASIKLRLTIISFFFIGGIIDGVFYTKYGLYTLIFAAAALAVGLIYDNIKFRLISLRRKLKNS